MSQALAAGLKLRAVGEIQLGWLAGVVGSLPQVRSLPQVLSASRPHPWKECPRRAACFAIARFNAFACLMSLMSISQHGVYLDVVQEGGLPELVPASEGAALPIGQGGVFIGAGTRQQQLL